MQNKMKWILGGVAAVLISGALFTVPALAEEPPVAPPFSGMMKGGMMNGSMMNGVMGMMGGNKEMMAMHNAMAPLMSQMPAMHEQMAPEVAQLFGMTVEELEQAMTEGKTMAQLAEEKKVAPGELQSLMTRSMKSFLDKAVEAGTITKEQANDIFQFHQKNSTDCINGNGPMGGMMKNMMGSGVKQ